MPSIYSLAFSCPVECQRVKTVAELIRHIADWKKECRPLMVVRSMLADGHGIEGTNDDLITLFRSTIYSLKLSRVRSHGPPAWPPRFSGGGRGPWAAGARALELHSGAHLPAAGVPGSLLLGAGLP